ncbi:hypothetical protein A4A49_09330 [Nicotiana attenuata]|uniref:DUF4283 domain-containing protein n=1 Tax=Nicotiana attenuata TaxID=49451 RepID=A0A314L9R0_NICAT|nr:hypothetical protein A4A49_09330 [Nicotiana attenuata]
MSFIKAASWPALELGGRCHRKLDVGQEPHFSLYEEHTFMRKGFLKSCLIGSFSKWVGSPEAVRNWAAEAWNVKDMLKISQPGDTQYLFRFVDESQASEILVRGNRWFDGSFLKLDRWVEHDGCLDPRSTGESLVVNMVGLPMHLWCLDLFKKIGEIGGVFIGVACSLHDLSRVRIVVRKRGKIPVSTVVEDGYLSYRVWLSPEFCPIFMPEIMAEENGRSNRREGRGNQRKRREWVSDAGWKGRMGRSSSNYPRARQDFSKYKPGPPHMGPATFPNSIRIDPKGPRLFQIASDKAPKHIGTVILPSSANGATHSGISSPSSSDLRPSSIAAASGAAPAIDDTVIPLPPAYDGPSSIAPSSAPGLSCVEATLQASSSSGKIVEHAPTDVSAGPVFLVKMPPRVPCSPPSCYPTGTSGHSYSSEVLISEVDTPQGNGEILSAPKVPIASNATVLYSSGKSKERVHIEDAYPISSRIGGGDMSFWMEDKLLNFRKFLGVPFEGKENRVLELLREIEQQSFYDGAGRELGQGVK